MSWQGIEGHDEVVEQLRESLRRGRLASTFLFVGPAGVGKRAFAEKFAQALLCQSAPEERLEPCGTCSSCQQVLAGSHPDLEIIARPPDRAFIPVSAFIGSPEKRKREGLCHNLGLKPYLGGRKAAIIDDADHLNAEGANALLKTLEEPPPGSVLILIGTSAEKQLPTIRSRSQIIRFAPLEPAVIARLLVEGGHVEDRAFAERLAAESGGSLAQALALADEGLWTFRTALLSELVKPDWNSVELAAKMLEFIESVGTEAARRRERARQLIGFISQFYATVARLLVAAGSSADEETTRLAGQAAARAGLSPERAAAAVDRCLEAIDAVQANAHLTAAIECFVDELRPR